LRIEELVLDGFSPADRYAIGEAVERELTRLFSERGIPPVIGDQIEISDLQGGQLVSSRDLDAEALGNELAKIVYRRLQR
jgi:hypothetical protein